jgi:hypothetical protein
LLGLIFETKNGYDIFLQQIGGISVISILDIILPLMYRSFSISLLLRFYKQNCVGNVFIAVHTAVPVPPT